MIGIAAEVRMTRIEQAIINSISVIPAAVLTRAVRRRERGRERRPRAQPLPRDFAVSLMKICRRRPNQKSEWPGDSGHSSIYKLDYGCTCNVASLVTSGIGFCCESFAFTCTIDRFELPGAIAFTTMPMIVPVPLTPAVFG